MWRIMVVGAVLLPLVMAVGCGKEESNTPAIDTKQVEDAAKDNAKEVESAVSEGAKKVEEAAKDADE